MVIAPQAQTVWAKLAVSRWATSTGRTCVILFPSATDAVEPGRMPSPRRFATLQGDGFLLAANGCKRIGDELAWVGYTYFWWVQYVVVLEVFPGKGRAGGLRYSCAQRSRCEENAVHENSEGQ